MKPPMMGPRAGPTNGDPVKIVIGMMRSLGKNMSTMVPAATPKKALPERPLRKRATKSVCMFGATAQGISQMRKKLVEVM
jgi:hypothetical protein